jgi:nucleotide-binding universal stress UspA family protein
MTMFRKILVPLDGSKLSEASLGAAALLASRFESAVTLVHVVEQDPPAEVHKEHHLADAEEARAYLHDVARRAFPAYVKVKIHVQAAPVADVARSIVALAAAELKPDLIVACTHGRGGVHGLLYGTIAQQIVAQGTTPLLLVRPDSEPIQMKRLLVPLDPDSIHDDSLPAAEALAKAFKAELNLVSIIPTYGSLTGEQAAASSLMPATTQAMLDLAQERASDHLNQHIEALERIGVRCQARIGRGDPVAGILKAAEETGADLIILSTHRKSGLGAFWSRSVAPSIAQRTKTPLLLLPLQ